MCDMMEVLAVALLSITFNTLYILNLINTMLYVTYIPIKLGNQKETGKQSL